MMSTRRTGPFQAIYASTTIPNTNPVAMTAFVAQGNAVKLFLTATGICNTVTISAEIAHDADGTFFDFENTWTVEFAAAGDRVLNLDGLGVCVGDIVRLSYQAETAAGALAVWALNYETTATGGSSGAVEVSSITGSVTLPTGAATETTLAAVQTAVELIDDAVATEDAAITAKGVSVVGRASTAQRSDMSDGDASSITLLPSGEVVGADYDWTGEYGRVAEQDPIWLQGEPTTVAAVTNGTDGTYRYPIDCASVKCLTIQGAIINGGSGSVTVTIEASNEPATAAAGCTKIDVTQYGFQALHAANAASYTAPFMLGSTQYFRARYAYVVVVADTGGANDGDWTIYAFDPAI